MLRGSTRTAVALAGFSLLSVAAQQPVFHSGTQTVAVYATVQDSNGHLVPDLEQTDFVIHDNGKPAAITVFSRDPQPLRLAVMLDTSMSMTGLNTSGTPQALQLRDAVLTFFDALGPTDRARLGTFGASIVIGANMVNDHAEFARVLQEEVWAGGGTPLWQALSAATTAIANEPGRRVVVAFTDGVDTGNLPGWDGGSRASVERQSVQLNSMVYAVVPQARSIATGQFSTRRLDDDARTLVEATGGGYIEVKIDGSLSAAFARVMEELRHQYLLGFVPAALDGRTHQLDVQVTRPGLKARARKNFIAGNGK